ncbi:hypothetical protein ACFW04_005726 [Cataglyphis niger]
MYLSRFINFYQNCNGSSRNLFDRRALAMETHMRTARTIWERSDKKQFPCLLYNVKAERCSTGTNHKLRPQEQSHSHLCGEGCHEEIRNRRGAALESGRQECPLAY